MSLCLLFYLNMIVKERKPNQQLRQVLEEKGKRVLQVASLATLLFLWVDSTERKFRSFWGLLLMLRSGNSRPTWYYRIVPKSDIYFFHMLTDCLPHERHETSVISLILAADRVEVHIVRGISRF